MAFLVAFEGIDGSGKGTQSALLAESLRREGLRVEVISFPRYQETRFGAAIADFLNGKFGQLGDVHPQLAALLFAGDRFESRDKIRQAADQHDVVIFDRYVASNMAHQAGKRPEPERSQIIKWIEAVEFDIFGLPRTDLTVLLDLPARTAQQLIACKALRTYTDKAADLHEADAAYLENVRQVYRSIAARDSNWLVIDCLKDESLRDINVIADEIHSRVASVVLSGRL